MIMFTPVSSRSVINNCHHLLDQYFVASSGKSSRGDQISFNSFTSIPPFYLIMSQHASRNRIRSSAISVRACVHTRARELYMLFIFVCVFNSVEVEVNKKTYSKKRCVYLFSTCELTGCPRLNKLPLCSAEIKENPPSNVCCSRFFTVLCCPLADISRHYMYRKRH